MNTDKVLITGSNKGIGKAIAELFGKDDSFKGTVILTSRNMKNGEVTRKELSAAFSDTTFDVVQLDICCSDSRAAAIKSIGEKYGNIDILINNAGVNTERNHPELAPIQQATDSFQVNYFATRDFTNDILPKVTKRVVNVNTRTANRSLSECSPDMKKFFLGIREHSVEEIDAVANDFLRLIADGKHGEKYSPSSYGMSKVCARVLMEKQAQDPKWSKLKFFQGTPGWSRTDMGGGDAPRSAQEGADVFWWLATTQDEAVLEKGYGSFYGERKLNVWDGN